MAVKEGPSAWMEGGIVATDVALEVYMERYAARFCEWVEGVVIRVTPSELGHNQLTRYLHLLIDAYFELKPIGTTLGNAFVMRLPEFPNRRREPDLMIVLQSNPHELKDTYLDGPADIVIEVVSEESIDRDHGEKFAEYEKGGVPEYWIVDPLHREGRFYQLDDEGRYRRLCEDENGNLHTPTLPGLVLHVPTLWADKLPGPAATVSAMQEMLA